METGRSAPGPAAGGASCRPGATGRPGVRGDEVAHPRVHVLGPAAAAEDAVVAGAHHGVVLATVLGDRGAQVVRGAGLAEAGDVVELALDGHQRGAGDL